MKFLKTSNLSQKTKGFIALVSVLVIGAVGISVAVSLILLGLGSSRTSFSQEQSNQAKGLASACAEKALSSLKQDLNYKGNETLNLGQGSCEIKSVSGSGNNNRTIQTIGRVGRILRRTQIVILEVNPQTQISSWREVADF